MDFHHNNYFVVEVISNDYNNVCPDLISPNQNCSFMVGEASSYIIEIFSACFIFFDF